MGLSNENLVTKYFVSSSLYSLVMILVQMIAKLLAIYLILRAVPAINLCAISLCQGLRLQALHGWKIVDEHLYFNEYLLMGWSESH